MFASLGKKRAVQRCNSSKLEITKEKVKFQVRHKGQMVTYTLVHDIAIDL